MPEDVPRRSLLEVAARPGPETTLVLTGEIDPGTAPVLQDHIDRLAADPAVTSVVVDLAGITFLDSSGIRAIIAGSQALQAGAAELRLRSPNANVRRVLEVTGLTDLIAVD